MKVICIVFEPQQNLPSVLFPALKSYSRGQQKPNLRTGDQFFKEENSEYFLGFDVSTEEIHQIKQACCLEH